MLTGALSIYRSDNPSVENFSQLTTLPGFALSVEYFEARNRFYADARESLFPEMRPINTMDFVYAK